MFTILVSRRELLCAPQAIIPCPSKLQIPSPNGQACYENSRKNDGVLLFNNKRVAMVKMIVFGILTFIKGPARARSWAKLRVSFSPYDLLPGAIAPTLQKQNFR